MKHTSTFSLMIYFTTLLTVVVGQTYDPNFYDNRTLYENAELLQLSQYEKQQLKNEMINKGEVRVLIEQNSLYDFESPIDEREQGPSQQGSQPGLSFENISNQVRNGEAAQVGNDDATPPEDTETSIDTYFIDF